MNFQFGTTFSVGTTFSTTINMSISYLFIQKIEKSIEKGEMVGKGGGGDSVYYL
jgi:hypothetical protein